MMQPFCFERGSSTAFTAIATLALCLCATLAHGLWRGGDVGRMETTRALVESVGLTDLALFTEARYARHRSQADLHSAFQDGPLSFEHFPTGTLIAPPRNFPPGGFTEREPTTP